MARWILAALVALHGCVHVLGVSLGAGLSRAPPGLAEVSQVAGQMSRIGALGWLVAGAAMLVTAGLIGAARDAWWRVAVPAVVLSQVMIVASWSEARFGTAANALILLAALHALVATGPSSLRAAYRQGVGVRLQRRPHSAPVTEEDAAHLPEPVRRYLGITGAIGRPRPTHLRATWRGRIRAGARDAWIPFEAEQHNFLDEPARFFWMSARRSGVPVDVLHAFECGEATMRARVLSAFQVVSAHGPEPTRAETVTLLNDLCLLAPGALVGPELRWETVDERSARVHYTLGPNTVSAVIHFDGAGDLIDFVSDDRLVASRDGKAFTRQRWSTPVTSHQSLGGVRVMRHGVGCWHPSAEPAFAYIELDLLDLELHPSDVASGRGATSSVRQ